MEDVRKRNPGGEQEGRCGELHTRRGGWKEFCLADGLIGASAVLIPEFGRFEHRWLGRSTRSEGREARACAKATALDERERCQK
jgi:hypothetical protein